MPIDRTPLLPAHVLDELRRQATGRVAHPGDEDWEAVRHGWNLVVDQRPAALVEVHDIGDIVTAVRVAAEHDLAVAAQPVGHGATAAMDGTILLRTGRLDRFSIDRDTRTAHVGPGVRWRQVSAALAGTGLTGLPGSSSDPTVVGYTVGGGLSWFGRRFGLAANHVRAVEMVDPNGALVRVTSDSDPDLFWAVRGGGGDFGIVTALEFELFPAEHLYGGMLLWPIADAEAVLATYLDITRSAPDELSVWALLMNVPDEDEMPPTLRGRWAVGVAATYLGPAEDGVRYLKPLRDVTEPLLDSTGPLALDALSDVTGEPTDPTPVLDTSMLLDRLDKPSIDALLATVDPRTSSLTMLEIRHLGGALSRPLPSHGAAGVIEEPYALVALGVVPIPEMIDPVMTGLHDVEDSMSDYWTGRSPVNTGDQAARIYPPAVLDRLRAIKRARDPHGRIRSNRPVIAAPPRR